MQKKIVIYKSTAIQCIWAISSGGRALDFKSSCPAFESRIAHQMNTKIIFSIHLYLWPVGQAVKTSPFHGGDMGSIPVRVTKKTKCHFSSVGRATDL